METAVNFEILLADNPIFMDDWENRANALVNGYQTCKPLFPFSTNPYSRRMFYLTVLSDKNPWELAAEIEGIPHIEHCIPDLETYTDVGIEDSNQYPGTAQESFVFQVQEKPWNEPDFLSRWANSATLNKVPTGGNNNYRWWNWFAVNYPPPQVSINLQFKVLLQSNLSRIRAVQLDTGYTRHSKVFGGYDLNQDYDFIDTDEDAEDSLSAGILRQPGHGTRTASILIGTAIKNDVLSHDGNAGLLSINNELFGKLIPYRIAKSVILIGRGKELIDAVKHALRNNTDVMFMCMGSYPRPMIEVIAREVYYKGIIWVCAAGNEVELVVAPAMYAGTIAVAAINPDDRPWKGSSNGEMVDIAAPGEDVYVPVVDSEGNESMRYGSGTSYATPHVAAAAILWKAKNLNDLKIKYNYPWQTVEAFRHSIRKCARIPVNYPWNTNYGDGILDLSALLNEPLPDAALLKDAYSGKPDPQYKDLGIREAVHYIWNVVLRKLKPGSTESLVDTDLTERGRKALEAYTKLAEDTVNESLTDSNNTLTRLLLRDFFEQNVP